MRSFRCDSCDQLVFFHNDTCLSCRSPLGFRPSTGTVDVLRPSDVRCAQHQLIGCNWLLEDAATGRCIACRTTRTTPPQGDDELLAAWRATEGWKRRAIQQLLSLGLPVDVAEFDLVSSRVDDDVMIGHAEGIITIDVDETDDARRERMRERLDEPYRTVLGHVRHELGHALFPLLVTDHDDDALAGAVRDHFGDWTTDYQAALDDHYDVGPPPGWQQHHVSAYATMHPAEDWAETFAHHLHISDVQETAAAFGLRVDAPPADAWSHARADAGITDDGAPSPSDLRERLASWLPLTYALNAVTRAMGEDDLYPFVLTEPVIAKLELVDRAIAAHQRRPDPPPRG